MEAQAQNTPIIYDNETEQYSGIFNATVVDKFIEQGLLELVHNQAGLTTLLLNYRDDFLSSFAAGVNEARLGRDQYYADYNANPFAFSIGFEHFVQYNKKKRYVSDYFCHGFICEQTEEAYQQ